ncbi:isochorismatase family protein [Rhizobium sp. CF142]|uniref:isochorismatase family protein n=1 Tax=Rhizobium sp. CF142 TaxID=1144314 RepID=UPI00026EEC1F|nr:isochorismatase family protein [Rhizobium sp. CF142]EJJ26698.1 nicotinamidase-like amidase [Rhizobium sp. CF142]
MDDKDIFKRQNFGRKMGFGQSPGLLVIDFTVGFNDPDSFGGGNISAAVNRTVDLLTFARARGMPIAHTRIVYADDGSDAGIHCLKVPKLKGLTEASPLGQFVPEVAPRAGEIVVRKRLPSAFFETGLHGILHARGIDTLIIAGCTTSGCVRASTLDAMCHGFRPIVASDCVGDRAIGPHEASLFDLGQKYADVMPLDDIIATLGTDRAVA